MKKQILIAALATFGAMNYNNANATLITFNSLAGTKVPGSFHVDSGLTMFNYPAPMNLDGFNFSNTSFNIMGPANIYSAGGDTGILAWNGTDFLSATTNLIVKKIDGGTFSLNNIDLARTYDGIFVSLPTVTIIGSFVGGGTISQSFNINSKNNAATGPDFTTFSMNGFNNLSSFMLINPTTVSVFAIDNLNLSVSTVPEPNELLLMLSGLGLVSFMTARRKTKSI